MSAPAIVRDLVRRFNLHLDNDKRGRYNDTQVRVEYIDPLFIALGWDMRNEKGNEEVTPPLVINFFFDRRLRGKL